MSFKAIRKIKILSKISGFTVITIYASSKGSDETVSNHSYVLAKQQNKYGFVSWTAGTLAMRRSKV